MKVMCINDNWKSTYNDPHPVFGDVDEVIGFMFYYRKLFYKLSRFGGDLSYRSDHFILISDIDETEMVRENLSSVETI